MSSSSSTANTTATVKKTSSAGPKPSISKVSHQSTRPPRAAKTKVVEALDKYRKLHANYIAECKRYMVAKKQNPNATKPTPPYIPKDFRECITGKDEDDETSDGEFHAASESSESIEDDDDETTEK